MKKNKKIVHPVHYMALKLCKSTKVESKKYKPAKYKQKVFEDE